MDIRRAPGWRLVCAHDDCGHDFPDDTTIGVVQAHCLMEHAQTQVKFDLVWKGEGPAPVKKPKGWWN